MGVFTPFEEEKPLFLFGNYCV